MNKHKEFRVFGPPGTGKTTYITKQIQAAIDKHGVGSLLVASFTKAASKELAGRNMTEEANIGTLHAHCYRALGKGEIAENHIDEFNAAFPHLKLSAESGKVAVEDSWADSGPVTKTIGDELFHRMNVLRARMVKRDIWPQNVRVFRNAWTTFKKSDKLIDFTDMIELAYQDIDAAPGSPVIGFFDEAQDFTPLELALVRKWGQNMDYIVIVGDDDQLLYSWLGASTNVFLQGEPDKKVILSQSHRIPAAVHRYADNWIMKIREREKKAYRPREFEGEVRRLDTGTFREAERIVADSEKYLAADKTVMFLASCSYLLHGITAELRRQGIIFFNPYRERQGAWNPVRMGDEDRVTTLERLLAFVSCCPEVTRGKGLWTENEFRKWAEIVRSKGNLKRGTKKKLKESSSSLFEVEFEDLVEVFEENSSFWQVLDSFNLDNALRWFVDNVQSGKRKALEFPAAVLKKHRNAEIFQKRPQVIVGTVHSVKGGECDVCYLCPDLSVAGMQAAHRSREERNSVLRMFYVGMTRPRESLVLCAPTTNYCVRW